MTPPLDLPGPLDALLAGMDGHYRECGLPWVTLSYAQSLDGSISAHRSASLILSGPAALEITHSLRVRHQAILVGIGTVLADDPQLNVRLVPGDDPQPVVLDNQLRFPLKARLLQGQNPPWVMTSRQACAECETALVQAGARVFRSSTGQVDLIDMLHILGQEGVRSVMVEGGAQVITAFLQAQLVDALVITISPSLVGGVKAVESLLSSRVSPSGPQNFPRLDKIGLQRIGDDLLIWGRPTWASQGEPR